MKDYLLSEDYNLMYKLLCDGINIACFVDYQFKSLKDKFPPSRDLCLAKRKKEFDITFQVRGMEYGSVSHFEYEIYTEFQLFKAECERMNVKFILL